MTATDETVEITVTCPAVAGAYGQCGEHVATIVLPWYFRDLTPAQLIEIFDRAFPSTAYSPEENEVIRAVVGLGSGSPLVATCVDRDAVLSRTIQRLHAHCMSIVYVADRERIQPQRTLRRLLHHGARAVA